MRQQAWWRWAIGLVVLAGVAVAGREPLAHVPWGALRWGWAAASLPGLAAALGLGAWGWQRWVLASGGELGFLAAFRILYLANLAKYLPGAGWHFAGRLVLAREAGVEGLVASAAMALDVVGHLVGAIAFALLCGAVTGQLPAPLAAALGALLLAGMHPRVLRPALALAGRLLRREPPMLRFGYGTVLAQLLLYTLDWCAIGAGFVALAMALEPVGQPVAVAGALALGWIAGALALFAPAGLGVREAALAVLLGPLVPQAALLALTSRAWFMLGELGAFLVAWGLKRERPGRPRS